MSRCPWICALHLLVAMSIGSTTPPIRGQTDVHALIKPQPGESRWMQLPWLTSVWEARQQAAAEGKPIFIWAGACGAPVGVC